MAINGQEKGSGATEPNNNGTNNFFNINNDNTKQGDLASIEKRLSEIRFLRHSVKLSPGVSKGDLRSRFLVNRNDWVERIGYAGLLDCIKEGYIHQLEDDETGYKDVIGLDFDFWDKTASSPITNALTIEEVKRIPTVARYGNFLQPSISHREDAQNCHVYIILSRPVTAEESNLITKGLVESCKSDLKVIAKSPESGFGVDACVANNSKQVIFASNADIVHLNHVCIADVDELLKLADIHGVKVAKGKRGRRKKVTPGTDAIAPQSPDTPPESVSVTPKPPKTANKPVTVTSEPVLVTDNKVTITDKVLEHLYQHLFLDIFESDPCKLYGLHPDASWSVRGELETGEVVRIEGYNPFSATNNSGNSFMVIHEEGQLPRFWDKSGSFEATKQSGYSSNQGTYLDYYFYIQQKYFKKFPGVKRGNDGSFPKGFFKVLVEDVISTFELPEFDWNCLDVEFEELKDHLIETFKGKIYYLGKDTYYFFADGIWQVLADYKMVFSGTIGRHLEENYSDRTIYQVKGKKKVIIKHDSELFLEVVRRMSHKYEFRMNTDEIPPESFRYVPLKNGLYDTKNKELIENDGRAWNRHIIPWRYAPETIDLKVIEFLKLYLKELFGSKVVGDLLFDWMMLNCQRRAFDTGRSVGVFGASGKGKTTYLLIMAKLLNGYFATEEGEKFNIPVKGYSYQPDKVGLTTNPHVTANFEGKTSILIQELSVDAKEDAILNFIKPFLGNPNSNVLSINQKFQPTRQVIHNMAFTFDCEKMPNINAEIHGHFRRTVFIKMPDDSPGCKAFNGKYMEVIEKNLEGIFNYALTLDTKELLDSFEKLSDSPEVKTFVTEVRQENSSLLDFYNDYFEITNDETDTVSFDVVFECLEKVNNNGAYCSKSIKKRVLINKTYEMLKDPTMDLKWLGDRNEAPKHCQMSKRTRRGYFTGIKLNREGLIKFGLYDSSVDKDF